MTQKELDLEVVKTLFIKHFRRTAGTDVYEGWYESVIHDPETFIKIRRSTETNSKARMLLCEYLYEHFSKIAKTKLWKVLA